MINMDKSIGSSNSMRALLVRSSLTKNPPNNGNRNDKNQTVAAFCRHFLHYSRCNSTNQRQAHSYFIGNICIVPDSASEFSCAYIERSRITHTLPSNAMQIERKRFVVCIEIHLVLFQLKCKAILLSVLKGNVQVFSPAHRCTQRIPRISSFYVIFRSDFVNAIVIQ